MYTQCPDCLTIYQLDAETVAKSRGKIRCAHCTTIFDSLRTLSERLPDEPGGQLRPHTPDIAPPELSVIVPQAAPSQAVLFSRPPTTRGTITPAFVSYTETSRPLRTWPWVVGSCALLLSFAAQLAYAKRDWLLNDSFARPWLDSACKYFPCQLPLRKDLGQMELLSRDIRPHPSVPNALIISATLHNAASFNQEFPSVEITLSDLDEKIIGRRRLQPQDYLNDKVWEAGMAADATAALVVEIVDPGKNAVAFEFAFY